MKRLIICIVLAMAVTAVFAGCGSRQESGPVRPADPEAAGTNNTEQQEPAPQPAKEEKETMLKMLIGNTAVAVDWEDNSSVEALKELCSKAPLEIKMSMYGGFEQVGPIGRRLPASDTRTVTSAGDIVLYSSDQLVVFYGSNSWAYTRLGHITDQDAAGMTALLGNGNVTITINLK